MIENSINNQNNKSNKDKKNVHETNTINAAGGSGKVSRSAKVGITSKTKTKVKPPSMYNVIMLNDDFTPMEFVVWVLTHYFDKSFDDAERLMLQVHNGNQAVVGTYSYDIATTKCAQVINEARAQGYPFKVITQKA